MRRPFGAERSQLGQVDHPAIHRLGALDAHRIYVVGHCELVQLAVEAMDEGAEVGHKMWSR